MKMYTNRIPGPEVRIGGEDYLYFGGTGYLGMQTDREFCEAIARHTLEIGAHWGASRGGNLVLSVYEKAEAALAAWVGSEACLTLSSGFMSARLLVEYYGILGHPRFFSPNCHEALLPPGAARTADWNTLQNLLREVLSKKGGKPPVVFTDTMGSDTRPGPVWELLGSLPAECILVADDSHGIGICGMDGSGSWKTLSEYGFKELLLCASLGKALGVTAGMIAGPSGVLDQLRATPFFAGASPAPPAGLGAMAETLERGRYGQKFGQLLQNVAFFEEKTRNLNVLSSSPGYPVSYLTDPNLASFLRGNRIFITDFDYAAEAGTTSPRRIVLSAAHEARHLDVLVQTLTGL